MKKVAEVFETEIKLENAKISFCCSKGKSGCKFLKLKKVAKVFETKIKLENAKVSPCYSKGKSEKSCRGF
ncbi:hypothetical protein FACS1894132_00670 [Clostridia bacterium]|nr:hypothetical protein FACS1894132_00670 [Clostridia bacterium]